MTDAELLLLACRRTPGDDTVRLALADELTATGFDGAAQFIRNEIEWFRVGKPIVAPRAKTVHKAGGYVAWLSSLFPDDAIIHNHGTVFVIFLPGADRQRTVVHTERGLPLDVVATAPHFMGRAESLFRFPVREVLLGDRRPTDGGPHFLHNFVWNRATWPQKFNTWEESPASVPAPLYDFLPMPNLLTGFRPGHYASRTQAQIALSLAALDYGNRLVGSNVETVA